MRLDSRGQVLRGGMSGEVIVPGQSGASLLIQHLTGDAKPRMPHEKPALDSELVARIAAWIDAGAKGADEAVAGVGPTVAHWSYRTPRRPPLPAVRNAAWVRSPIDAFVLARLEREGLAPSPEASREALVRRLSLDLVGLPPSVAEIDAFVNDPDPGAYAAVVERLLASPHYGERWARPWLDLARYADTNGYEKDQRRTAWKYRDWVISALNRDLSFRDFTIEQLAGDMLQDASVEQRIATGFHRNTQLNQEGGIDVEEQRFETLVDRVATTGTAWLGSTIACAQCHNHKFDPVSQKDYYRMLAFFDNAEYRVHGQGEEVVDRWIEEPELELTTLSEAERRAALRREAEALRLELGSRALDAEIAAFEREIAGPAPVFTPLAPVRFVAKSGASAETLADGSLRVCGKPEEKDSYTVTVHTSLAGITGFRLEALPDDVAPAARARPLELGRLRRDVALPQRRRAPAAARSRSRRYQRETARGRPAARRSRRDGLGRHGRDGGRAPPLRGGGAAAAARRDPGAAAAPLHARVPVGRGEPRPLPALGHHRQPPVCRPARAGRGAGAPRHARRRPHGGAEAGALRPGSVRSPPRSTPRATAPARSRSSSTR